MNNRDRAFHFSLHHGLSTSKKTVFESLRQTTTGIRFYVEWSRDSRTMQIYTQWPSNEPILILTAENGMAELWQSIHSQLHDWLEENELELAEKWSY